MINNFLPEYPGISKKNSEKDPDIVETPKKTGVNMGKNKYGDKFREIIFYSIYKPKTKSGIFW